MLSALVAEIDSIVVVSFYAWEFEKDGEAIRVRADGQFAFNGVSQIPAAALDGLGLAYLPEDFCRPSVAEGRFAQVLDDWRPRYRGYPPLLATPPSASPAYALIVEPCDAATRATLRNKRFVSVVAGLVPAIHVFPTRPG